MSDTDNTSDFYDRLLGDTDDEISEDFSMIISLTIGNLVIKRLTLLYPNEDIETIRDTIVEQIFREISSELALSVEQKFNDQFVPLELLMPFIENWTPEFFITPAIDPTLH
jgi:hypothetical protein